MRHEGFAAPHNRHTGCGISTAVYQWWGYNGDGTLLKVIVGEGSGQEYALVLRGVTHAGGVRGEGGDQAAGGRGGRGPLRAEARGKILTGHDLLDEIGARVVRSPDEYISVV